MSLAHRYFEMIETNNGMLIGILSLIFIQKVVARVEDFACTFVSLAKMCQC